MSKPKTNYDLKQTVMCHYFKPTRLEVTGKVNFLLCPCSMEVINPVRSSIVSVLNTIKIVLLYLFYPFHINVRHSLTWGGCFSSPESKSDPILGIFLTFYMPF